MTRDGPIQHALEGSSQGEKKTKEIIRNRKIIAASLKILSKTISSIVFYIFVVENNCPIVLVRYQDFSVFLNLYMYL